MSLVNGADSNYIKAARALHHNKSEIRVYVEDEIDVAFWNVFLGKYKCKYDINIAPATNPADNTVVCGKSNIFTNVPISTLGLYKIICVDSDYDEIIPNYPNSHPESLKCSFVVRTFVYAIENMKCDVSNFDDFVTKTTLTSNADKSILLHTIYEISRFLYKVMPIHLAHVDLQDNQYDQQALFRDLKTLAYRQEDTVDSITKRVNMKIDAVTKAQNHFLTLNKEKVSYYKKKIEQRCYKKYNLAYQFINGHDLTEFVASMLEVFCQPLRDGHINDLKRKAKKEERKQHIAKYINRTQAKDGIRKRIEKLISDCTTYKNDPFFKKVQKRVDKAIKMGQILERLDSTSIGGVRLSVKSPHWSRKVKIGIAKILVNINTL